MESYQVLIKSRAGRKRDKVCTAQSGAGQRPPTPSPSEAQPREDAGPPIVDTSSAAGQESTRPQSGHPHDIRTSSSPQARPTVSKVPLPLGAQVQVRILGS